MSNIEYSHLMTKFINKMLAFHCKTTKSLPKWFVSPESVIICLIDLNPLFDGNPSSKFFWWFAYICEQNNVIAEYSKFQWYVIWRINRA